VNELRQNVTDLGTALETSRRQSRTTTLLLTLVVLALAGAFVATHLGLLPGLK